MNQKIKPIHPFPARMAPELVWGELPNSQKPLKVLDPMAGSGTTLVAARLSGHEAIGFDRDPLAVLIAKAWIGNLDSKKVIQKASEVLEQAKSRVDSIFPLESDDETKKFIEFWFDLENRKQLTALSASISAVSDSDFQNILWCAFSRLVITKKAGVSLAMDVSHSRPHRVFDVAPRRAFDYFLREVQSIAKIAPFANSQNIDKPQASIGDADARSIPLADKTIDLIITSPPYLNAIDYLRGHKLSLVWMKHSIADIRKTRSTNIGTAVSAKKSDPNSVIDSVIENICSGMPLDKRNEGVLRKYLIDLHLFLKECNRVLKQDGKGVFVIGDCNLRNTFISNATAIELIGLQVGFQVETSWRRPLPENRRYLPPPSSKFSGAALQKRMREEVILKLRKI